MKKFSIVTDSTMGVDLDLGEKLGIHVISNGLSLEGQDYRDYIDIDTAGFIELEEQYKSLPKTGAASPGHSLIVMEEATEESENVLVIAMTSGYSGGVNTRRMMAEELNDEGKNVKVFEAPIVFDGGIPYYEEAIRYREAGKSLEEALVALESLNQHTSSVYLADPYFITGNGRFKETMEEIGVKRGDGQLAGVEINSDPSLIWKATDIDQGFEKLINELDQAVTKAAADDTPLQAIVSGNKDLPEEAQLVEMIKERYPDMSVRRWTMAPTSAAQLGPGAIGIIWSPARPSI